MRPALFSDIIKHQREMTKNLIFIAILCAVVPNIGRAACSRANLIRCLDSACAINSSSNPAARCQYCGTADAGDPDDAGLRAISVGTSSRFSISARDLKNAPTDPGERYVWAARKCLSLIDGCTAENVSEFYDSLIEQSCTAAGIKSQMTVLQKQSVRTKTSTICKSEITACVVADARCSAHYTNCATDSEFDKHFSECAVTVDGCDQYLPSIRGALAGARTNANTNAESTLTAIVQSYRDARERRMTTITKSCETGDARDTCIASVCNRSMANKCDSGHPEETSMATQLCKFYDTACSTLK